MSKNKRLPVYLKLFAAALPVCGAAALLFGFEHMPENAVIYAGQDFVSVTEESPVIADGGGENAEKYENDTLYGNFSDVPTENYLEYMVKTLNGRIYVTDMNGNLLCRVKADISEFPESDAGILRAGMKVTGRELKEIVAYLES